MKNKLGAAVLSAASLGSGLAGGYEMAKPEIEAAKHETIEVSAHLDRQTRLRAIAEGAHTDPFVKEVRYQQRLNSCYRELCESKGRKWIAENDLNGECE